VELVEELLELLALIRQVQQLTQAQVLVELKATPQLRVMVEVV
jgi:hypothetical protein